MIKDSSFKQYRQRYSVADHWKLIANNTDHISQVVVIPAFAEKNTLFSTLASLARNQPSSLDYSLILCVINNKKNSSSEVKKDNRQTLECLQALLNKKSLDHLNLQEDLKYYLQVIDDARLRLGYIDAASAGLEIPANEGGVGMARKIGMDAALGILMKNSLSGNNILSLDADTLVQSNYLTAVKNCLTPDVKTAIVAYKHQEPAGAEERAAIYCYEIFLRYWMSGLKYAKSPYAFHSIGSTMACSCAAYLTVRGMNRREAGEDFYFLNKLAKIGDITYTKETCVYPSARSSERVPFGTGKRIKRFLRHECDEYVLPDPRVFDILAKWLQLMEHPYYYEANDIMRNAGEINSGLASFLNDCCFPQSWIKMRCNAKNEKNLIKQFHSWFDGFKTLKLINYLTRVFFAPVNMFAAVENILQMQKLSVPAFVSVASHPGLDQQKNIVQYLRQIT